MAKATPRSYKQMSQELSRLIEWFEGDQLDLDEAVEKYQQAMQLISEMETHLKLAENKVKKIAVKFERD